MSFIYFEHITKEVTFYLGDIPITAQVSNRKMKLKISASKLPQNIRYQKLNIYIKDKQGNKLINYFIYPIEVLLEYKDLKPLEIQVSNY